MPTISSLSGPSSLVRRSRHHFQTAVVIDRRLHLFDATDFIVLSKCLDIDCLDLDGGRATGYRDLDVEVMRDLIGLTQQILAQKDRHRRIILGHFVLDAPEV
jgi:hypothetical protein